MSRTTREYRGYVVTKQDGDRYVTIEIDEVRVGHIRDNLADLSVDDWKLIDAAIDSYESRVREP